MVIAAGLLTYSTFAKRPRTAKGRQAIMTWKLPNDMKGRGVVAHAHPTQPTQKGFDSARVILRRLHATSKGICICASVTRSDTLCTREPVHAALVTQDRCVPFNAPQQRRNNPTAGLRPLVHHHEGRVAVHGVAPPIAICACNRHA